MLDKWMKLTFFVGVTLCLLCGMIVNLLYLNLNQEPLVNVMKGLFSKNEIEQLSYQSKVITQEEYTQFLTEQLSNSSARICLLGTSPKNLDFRKSLEDKKTNNENYLMVEIAVPNNRYLQGRWKCRLGESTRVINVAFLPEYFLDEESKSGDVLKYYCFFPVSEFFPSVHHDQKETQLTLKLIFEGSTQIKFIEAP